MPCHDEIIHIPMKIALHTALPGAPDDERYAAVEAATTLTEEIRDEAVADRDRILRKIFAADLVDRRRVRRSADLTLEEATVLDGIVPLNPCLPYPCVACTSGRHDYCAGCTCSEAGHDLPRWKLRYGPHWARTDPDPDDPKGDTW